MFVFMELMHQNEIKRLYLACRFLFSLLDSFRCVRISVVLVFTYSVLV